MWRRRDFSLKKLLSQSDPFGVRCSVYVHNALLLYGILKNIRGDGDGFALACHSVRLLSLLLRKKLTHCRPN